MAINDFVYRLKPQSGDATPHDELGVSGDLTGGTITLVDMGSGDFAWQFAGKASAAGPSKITSWKTVGTGLTIAIRMAVATYDSSTYAYLAGWGTDATPARGPVIGQAGSNAVRARHVDAVHDTLSLATVGGNTKTYVLKLAAGSPGLGKIYAWLSGVTGSGDNADFVSSGQNYSTTGDITLDTIFCGSAGSVIRVADFVIWSEELSDADCHALAENGIRATLDAGGGGATSTVISATLANITGSVSSVSAPKSTISATLANVYGSVASSSGSLVTTITATLGNVVGAITSTGSTGSGTFTSEALKDYAGNVLANTALNFVRFYNDTTGALVLNKTGVSTNGSGIVTFSDAALVAGTTYRVDWETAAGSRRMPRKAAA